MTPEPLRGERRMGKVQGGFGLGGTAAQGLKRGARECEFFA
jgi:hypothetical protein